MAKKKESWFNELMSFLGMLAISFIAVYLFTHWIAKPVRVEGNSMYPTLHDDDVAFASLLNLELDEIQRFDIVVVYLPEQDKYVVKRVIGLPNETIAINNDQLIVNGKIIQQDFLDPDYVKSQSINGIFTFDIDPITLGPDEFYLLGDNRPNSQDSRYYGPFHHSQIVSRHLLIIYPFSRIGIRS